ncbi:hypothetical protein D1007_29605 [Hordeum vulgare]|nr:hypothetical protein D1007_29605 [Hordeum vulgare]
MDVGVVAHEGEFSSKSFALWRDDGDACGCRVLPGDIVVVAALYQGFGTDTRETCTNYSPWPASRWKSLQHYAPLSPKPSRPLAIDDLDDAISLASLASSSIAIAPSDKGKPCTPRKTATAHKKKKKLMPEEWARESAKRKGRRHETDAWDKAVATVVHQEDNAARVAVATREALVYLGLNPSQHRLVNAAAASASTGSSAFPRMALL